MTDKELSEYRVACSSKNYDCPCFRYLNSDGVVEMPINPENVNPFSRIKKRKNTINDDGVISVDPNTIPVMRTDNE